MSQGKTEGVVPLCWRVTVKSINRELDLANVILWVRAGARTVNSFPNLSQQLSMRADLLLCPGT